jgi:hypothetical protein
MLFYIILLNCINKIFLKFTLVIEFNNFAKNFFIWNILLYNMGCWDIFCFLCGNPCHKPSADLKDIFLENIEYYETIKNTNKKKTFLNENIGFENYNDYKTEPKKFLAKLTKFNFNSSWLSNCTFLSANNKIVHGCKEIGCNIEFIDKNKNLYLNQSIFESDRDMYGIFTHTDCWKYILKEYKIKLTYSHLPIINIEVTKPKVFDFIDYGKIEDYWSQDFNFIKMISDSNENLSLSPLKSDLVGKNIKRVFTKLKIKTNGRQSPFTSATFYTNNTYKIGSNGNIWIKKSGKWIELKDTVEYNLFPANKYLIKKPVYIGSPNTEPVFLVLFEKNKRIVISTKEYLDKKYKIKFE